MWLLSIVRNWFFVISLKICLSETCCEFAGCVRNMFIQTAAYNPSAVIKNKRNDQISEVALMVLFAPDALFW
jgi:hypothetical protein